ncbi:hypothetical protein MLD38_002721 [Melastoma candidum]|uniref:Uncharacterized protein n=1 Tax=Melastoma candidum TaxID=119954 RepID=A0ACB9S8U1_9MYRT|nr:hypothetical protein MLD38_002721 [Melastoma candidum]
MESDIDRGSPLQYASIQILSGQQRYDAYVCVANKVEKLSSGNLEHLLPLMPALKELYSKGSNCSFTLQLPENIRGSDWFTKSTFERFLRIVNSPDLISKTKPINQEMHQLEEARKFQLVMLSGVNQDQSGSGKNGGHRSDLDMSSSESGTDLQTSDVSRNDLLRAMDSRIAALTGELATAFAQTASATCSAEELIAIADFTQLFGATDLENALHRILETSQSCRTANSVSRIGTLSKLDAKNEDTARAEIVVAHSRPVQVEAHVKYSVSPAKVAEIERRSSSGSEEEPSDTDNEAQQTRIERSRTLMRSSAGRRSASPMRRVQLGRSGSHRAAAITIKSLNYFPVRSVTQADSRANDDEDQESNPTDKKIVNEVKKISVQDRIKIFESKQRDQVADIEKRRSSANFYVGASKSVLRRWSSSVGENSSGYEAEAVSEASASVHSGENASEGQQDCSPQRHPHSVEADEDVKLRENEDVESEPIADSVDKEPNEETTVSSDRLASPAEWNRQKEMELNEMMAKMMEVKNAREKASLSRNLDVPVENRGGFYDKYKQKRDERLRGENTGRKVEKQAQFMAASEAFTGRKAELREPNGSDGKKGVVKKPQKSLKSPSQTVKPKKENPVPTVAKKAPAKTGSLPAVRKSWPSTPASRTTGLSPSKASRVPSPAGTTPTRRKPQLPSPVPSSTNPKPKPERSPIKKVVKEENRAKNPRKLNGGEDKKPQTVPRASVIGKAKVNKGPTLNNDSAVAPAKPSFYNKVTKKGTVYPLESKPTRRSSGTVASVKKEAKQLGTSLNESQNSKEEQRDEQNVTVSDLLVLQEEANSPSTEPSLANVEPEVPDISAQKCDEAEDIGQVLEYIRSDLGDAVDAENEQAEEETDISPRAWVEIEEHQDIQPVNNDCTFEFVSRAIVVPAGSSSPRVRHSLSKMLQEESSEPDISEWGNAENPPSLIYQRDAPKGLKKLLKFARKSKGDANISGWSSPSVFSEGEDDVDDAKTSSKRSSENLLKAALHAKNFGPNESLSGDGISSSTTPTARATRSFFSLSAFRGSNKPGSDSKYR